MSATVFEDIKFMLKAYYPVLYLDTFEYERTKQRIVEVASQLDRNYIVYDWTPSDGLKDTSTMEKIEDLEDPAELLLDIERKIEEEERSKNSEYISPAEIYLLEDFHDYIAEKKVKIKLRQLSEKIKYFRKHIIIISPTLKLPIELEKYINVVNIPLPNRTELEKTLDAIIKSVDLDNPLDDELKKRMIDAALGMTVMEADLAFCLAAVKNNLGGDSPKIISKEKEQIIKKSGILDFFDVDQKLAGIGGMQNLKDWLQRRKAAFNLSAQQWGLPEPKGLLLTGVPGCGKSLTAKCISSLWNLPLLRLDMGKVFEGIVGSSENNIRKAIATAEAVAPCVLWIDEIEKGLSGSQSSGSTDGGTTARIFSTILTWMQEKTKPVFVIATANNINMLPPELLRKGRFDEIFFVDLPNYEDRKSIFKIHLEKNGRDSKKFGLDKLAEVSIGFNGAEIEECIKDAMFFAYSENPVNPELKLGHIITAIKKTVPLAKTMKQSISNLRNIAKTRSFVLAGMANSEELDSEVNGQKIVLTYSEKQSIRSFD